MNWIRTKLLEEKGVVAIFVALTLVIFIGIAALAVDVGYSYVARTELQRTSDSAALAATRRLGLIYEGMSSVTQNSYVLTIEHSALIKSAAKNVAILNTTAGEGVTIHDDDITIGTWHSDDTPPFAPTSTRPSAVHVVARRDNDYRSTGPITAFFARIWGTNTVSVSAAATASLTSEASVGPGKLPMPVGISKAWFENLPESCNQPIRFHPTGTLDGCAGFHVYGPNVNDSKIKKDTLPWLINLSDVTDIPGATVGVTNWNFSGGTMTSLCSSTKKGEAGFLELFDAMKVRNDGVWDLDTNPNTWTTAVVIYNRDDCSNPNQSIEIAGFSTVVIENVDCSLGGDWTIDGKVLCDIKPGHGSGGSIGTLGSIPNLVR